MKSSVKFELPTVEDAEEELKQSTDLGAIKERIHEIVEVLGNFKERRQDGRSRSEYLQVLKLNLKSYYDGYNDFLLEKFMELFPNPGEVSFLSFLWEYTLTLFHCIRFDEENNVFFNRCFSKTYTRPSSFR